MTTPFISPFAVPADDVGAAEYAAAQLREYSKWEAATTIPHGNAIAYHEGHPIPIDNVERLGYAKAGLARLAHEYIDRNPEDPDVQRFTAFGEKYPDHPDVRRYAAHLAARKAAEDAAGPVMPNPFADDPEPPVDDSAPAGKGPGPSSMAAGVVATDPEAPGEPGPAAEGGRKPVQKAREAKISGAEG